MKRHYPFTKTTACRELPQELWSEIARNLLGDTAAVFQFMLVSQSARKAMEPILLEWYSETKKSLEHAMFNIDSSPPSPSSLLNGTLYNRSWSQCINYFETHDFPGLPFSIPATDVDMAYVLLLFYIWHITRLEKSWGCRQEDELSENNLLHSKLHLSGLRLRDAFYLDKKSNQYKPLKHLHGLRIVPMDTTRVGLMERAIDFISQQHDDPHVKQLKVLGLVNTKSPLECRVAVHALMKDSLKQKKPHGSDFLCNAVWCGRHIFDNDNIKTKTLGIRVYRVKSDSKQKKLKVLEVRRSVKSRSTAIRTRLRDMTTQSIDNYMYNDDNDNSELSI